MNRQSWGFKALVAGVGLAGLVLTVFNSNHVLESFSYFTTLSNLLATMLFIGLTLYGYKHPYPECRYLDVFKGMVTLGLLVTLLVYHLVLRPILTELYVDYQVFGLQDLIVHYFMPVLVLLDFGLFDRRGRIRNTDPLLWLLFPLAYTAYIALYGFLGGRFAISGIVTRYPYFFLDVSTYGWGTVIFWSALILVVFLLCGWAFYLFDRGLLKRKSGPR